MGALTFAGTGEPHATTLRIVAALIGAVAGPLLPTSDSFGITTVAERPLRGSCAAPVAAAVLLVVTLGFALAQFATLLGPSASPIRVWGVPLAFAAVFVVAFGRGLYLHRYRNEAFLRLGTGPSATGSTQA